MTFDINPNERIDVVGLIVRGLLIAMAVLVAAALVIRHHHPRPVPSPQPCGLTYSALPND